MIAELNCMNNNVDTFLLSNMLEIISKIFIGEYWTNTIIQFNIISGTHYSKKIKAPY